MLFREKKGIRIIDDKSEGKIDQRLVVGCMTGTSIDGLDLALVRVSGYGLDARHKVMKCLSKPLGDLANRLRLMAQGNAVTAKEIVVVSNDIANLHLEAIKELVRTERIELIAVHGQTLYHAPPLSLQIINPMIIAADLKVPVVSDLRSADLAHGGQGAPITPVADFLLFRSLDEARCVINLGGFCSLTLIPKCTARTADGFSLDLKQVKGGDVCVCNQVLDTLARVLYNYPMDRDGACALNGKVLREPFIELEQYLRAQSELHRSLGTGDELVKNWLSKFINKYKRDDLLCSACAAIASTVAFKSKDADRIILAGGGVKNRCLVNEIISHSDVPVELSDQYGIDTAYREAVAMATLGALCKDRVPITLPQITGAKGCSISGVWALP